MSLRFQADADFNGTILRAVLRREPGLEVQTAEAAGLRGLSDLEVLAITARDRRVLLTHDQRTMPRHFGEFIATEMSPGVLIVPQRLSISVAMADIVLIGSTMDAAEWTNTIRFLPL
jgi:hypothetical protein